MNAFTKKGMAPEEPMMGLFESRALRLRKLATMASEIEGEIEGELIRVSIL